jgi:hypothetical protein
MAEADWHLKDLLSFYVSKCRNELVGVSEDPVRAETMFEAVKRVREILILMSCMVGAFTPSEIAALHRLDQIRLVAENEAAQMLRVGEEMALLRMWLKSAVDPQWNVEDAIRLLRSGRLTPSSSFPEMTRDLLTSVKKQFIVPSSLPANYEGVRAILRASISAQFARAKQEPPFVPQRVTLAFEEEDDSVILSSFSEFRIKGIFDHRRWTVIEAQILDDEAGRHHCRHVLQAVSSSSISEMCVAALRMATAQKLKNFQDEAVALTKSWTSIHSVYKSKAGLGNGFTVGVFKRLPYEISVCFEMNFDNGDLIVTTSQPEISNPVDYYAKSFLEIIQQVEHDVRVHSLSVFLPSLIPEYTVEVTGSALMCREAGALVTVSQSGTFAITPVFSDEIEPVSIADASKLAPTLQTLAFVRKWHSFLRDQETAGYRLCAAPEIQPGQTELVRDLGQVLDSLVVDSLVESEFVCGLTRGDVVSTVTFDHTFSSIDSI